jgi:thiol-disulfide isomerase/thioredoxin
MSRVPAEVESVSSGVVARTTHRQPATALSDHPVTQQPVRRRFRWGTFIAGAAVGCLVAVLSIIGFFMWSMRSMMAGGKLSAQLAETFQAPPVPRAASASYAWDLRDLDGVALDTGALRGRVLFVNMWATWCPPCVAELPSVARLRSAVAARLGPDRAQAVAFLCISSEGLEKVRGFQPVADLDLPAYVLDGPQPTEFASQAIPATFVVDPAGRIVFQHVGGARWDDPACVDYLVSLANSQE